MVLDVLIFAFAGKSSFAWTSDRILAIVMGIFLAILSIALILASWTRWGQTKALTKCIILSVLAHVWLLMYAYGTRVVRPGFGPGTTPSQTIAAEWIDETAEEEPPTDPPQEVDKVQPWEKPISDVPPEAPAQPLNSADLLAPASVAKLLDRLNTVEPPSLLPSTMPEPTPVAEPAVVTNEPAPIVSPEPPVLPPNDPPAASTLAQSSTLPSATPVEMVAQSRVPTTPAKRQFDQQKIADIYRLRAPDARRQAAQQYGGDSDTEAAVDAALLWLKAAQDPQGFWDADRFGAGRETKTLGEDRNGSGRESDTGMTGLAMLAFLGAGNTHVEGDFQDTMRGAAAYLLRTQMPSGDLSGPRQVGSDRSVYFARMYCHGMATLALAELYAMTGDPQLLPGLTKAAEYTLRAQNTRTGGWRYQARETNDPGDLSQFGWHAMSLNSCENGGLRLPDDTRTRFSKFLDLVSAGKHGGLAVYRPVPGQTPTAAMTAEAMASRLLLGMSVSVEAEQEAKSMLLANLPGQSEDNLYYWYYATIAMFQYQDHDWERWNEALKLQLLNAQVAAGSENAGSWNPTCVWSGYGGRVYSTAMSCMCLEVYYRFLPMYQRSQLAQGEQWRR